MSNYVCSDLHGNGELWKQIKEFLEPNDTLYFLGDAADRGPDGWNILKDIMKDERIIYILGNHDAMLYDRIKNPDSYETVSLHIMNGGLPTWELAENDPEAINVAEWLNNCPLYIIYENTMGAKIFMSHSGSTNVDDKEDLLWDRSEYIDTKRPDPYDVVIHGHTNGYHIEKDLNRFKDFYEIEESIPEYNGGAYWYNDYRCCIDCRTIASNRIVLVNLDTFEEKIFSIDL